MLQSLLKIISRFPKKLKTELSYDSAAPLLGTYPKKMETPNQKDTVLTAALLE